MKHLRKFNEELVPRFPVSRKGEVIVFTNRNSDITDDFVKAIATRLGYNVAGEAYDNGYIIKTNPGEEEQAGSDFVNNYPEFFTGYEREDAKDKYLYDELDYIIDDIEDLRDSLGSLNKFRKSNLPTNWNDNIDKIIKRLQNAKHE